MARKVNQSAFAPGESGSSRGFPPRAARPIENRPQVRKLPRILAGVAALAVLATSGVAAEVQRFHLSQVSVQLPQIKAYADVLDSSGNPIADAASIHPTATAGSHALKLLSFTPFDNTGEGVAYVFVIDTSESIEKARFDAIRASIEQWVQDSGAKDRTAIIQFAEKVDVLADFTDGKEKTLAAAHRLTSGGKRSLIYQALKDAIELCLRRDADLPTRRAIVIVTDGKDEGSGLNADDIIQQATDAHVPVNSIGYSNLPAAERRQYLDELHRISEKSGGVYAEVTGPGLTAAFPAMEKAIRRAFVATFTCAECAADSKKYRFEMGLQAGTRVFSDGFDVMMVAGPPPPTTPSTPGSKKSAPVKTAWWIRPWWVYAAAGGVLVALIAGLILWRRSVRIKREQAERAAAEMRRPIVLPGLGSSQPKPEPAAGPQAGIVTKPSGPFVHLQLTVVRGRNPGATSQLKIESGPAARNGSGAKLVIGRKAGCDLSLTGDETVSSEHCEITWSNDRLVVRDLHSSNGTLVNGVAIAGDQPLENGDRLGIGRTEYRVGVVSDRL